uniref:Omega-class glutathione transferase n=1 Tax=Nephromyces sp. MMRI TaxID=2496275 RepID=A0A3S8V3B1_9APIC|nr:omega-class glutathione transferase [Nephromyces sp. MMRI]
MMATAALYKPTVGKSGEFIRRSAKFRNWVKSWSNTSSEEKPTYVAEKGRYHLFVAYACPWACRCLAVRNMKRLENVISVSVVHSCFLPTRDPAVDPHVGWHFRNPTDEPVELPNGAKVNCDDYLTGCPDPVTGCVCVRDIYEQEMDKLNFSEEERRGVAFSVPILYCKKTNHIVCNESEDIIRILTKEFDEFCEDVKDEDDERGYAMGKNLNLFPEVLQEEILNVNKWIYENINNGVYRCGFAQSQEAYDFAAKNLFTHLDRVEEILSKQRYMVQNKFTEADIRLFVTLIRFDEVYVVHFKTSKKCIREYPNMLNFCRELYSIQAIKKSVVMQHIRDHYYTSHANINKFGIRAISPGFLDILESQPHDRNRFQ